MPSSARMLFLATQSGEASGHNRDKRTSCRGRCSELAQLKENENVMVSVPPLRGEPAESCLCEAERNLYEHGVPEGTRSWTALRLASRLRLAGCTEEEAARMVLSWNERNHPPRKPTEARRIVAIAYRAETPYRFTCGTGDNDPPHTKLVYKPCLHPTSLNCQSYQAFQAQGNYTNAKE